MTQKEKLIKKVEDLDSKIVDISIHIQQDAEDNYPLSLKNKFSSILDSLPNRVLAKIIRDAKADLKKLKIEEKEFNRELKRNE